MDDGQTAIPHGQVLVRDGPHYKLYPANLNQIGPLGNPFEGVSP